MDEEDAQLGRKSKNFENIQNISKCKVWLTHRPNNKELDLQLLKFIRSERITLLKAVYRENSVNLKATLLGTICDAE